MGEICTLNFEIKRKKERKRMRKIGEKRVKKRERMRKKWETRVRKRDRNDMRKKRDKNDMRIKIKIYREIGE